MVFALIDISINFQLSLNNFIWQLYISIHLITAYVVIIYVFVNYYIQYIKLVLHPLTYYLKYNMN